MANVFDRTIEAGELLVLRKDIFLPEFQTVENRFFIADGSGSGCYAETMGSAVYGYHPIDGERARWEGDEDFDAAETAEWQEKLGKFGEGAKAFIAALAED